MDKCTLMKRSSLSLLMMIGALLLQTHAGAAPQNAIDPLITDRPDFTESTETVPVGMTQVEGGYTYSRTGQAKQHSYGELLIRHALGRKMELRLEVPSYARVHSTLGKASGFEDGSIGFKVMIAKGADRPGLKKPRVSLIGATSLPIGSRDFRERKLQPEVKLLLGWNLSEQVAVSSNLNYAYLSEDGNRYSEVSGSVSFGFSLSDRVGSYVEIFGFVPGGDRSNTRFINGGFTYLINNDFQLDTRLGCGLSNNIKGPDYFFGVGVARRF